MFSGVGGVPAVQLQKLSGYDEADLESSLGAITRAGYHGTGRSSSPEARAFNTGKQLFMTER